MSHPANRDLAAFVQAAREIALAPSLETFLEGLRNATQTLLSTLDEQDDYVLVSALEDAFAEYANDARVLSALHLAAWPVFDKPLLPLVDASGEGSILWMTALPAVLTFAPGTRDVSLERTALPLAELTAALRAAQTHPACQFRVLGTLLQSDDIRRIGPIELAKALVAHELGQVAELDIAPVRLSEDVPGWSSVVCWFILASRLPVSATTWGFDDEALELEPLAHALKDALVSSGHAIEDVRLFTPGSIAHTYLDPKGPYAYQLDQLVERASGQGARKLLVRQAHTDYLELLADDGNGPWGLLPPHVHALPVAEVVIHMRELAQYHQLEFSFQRHQMMSPLRH